MIFNFIANKANSHFIIYGFYYFARVDVEYFLDVLNKD